MAGDARWLMDGAGGLWLVREAAGTLSIARWRDGALHEDAGWREAGVSGWDATADSEGGMWVAWSREGPEGGVVFARRFADGAWGPPLQVSTTGSGVRPIIAPDEYGNVWVFWERRGEGADIVMCRLGPRSGQETLVARGAARPRSAATGQGVLYVVYGEDDLCAVTGTEHGGFGAPVRLG